ncbi:DUF72 domain-containing protein [Gemmata sp. JC673]|uniref:DUF72 domain-containing protein n=1 Tax=Gemmata algarum TaxID=2975278 RepID=A0ABU5FCF7_9BACT|nr:DUF72 domain-containing protein [Gemmata algarum]MDY3563501.1 DUF72 domain-containing protein [Gemmata algarum]
MNVRIGTAGYAYPAWVGGFYPPNTTQHDMLPYYAARFACVEINSSFYRPPTREQVAKMARRSPPGFGFTLKVPKTVSHQRSDDDVPAFKAAADHLAGTGKLLGLIFQLPESFRNTADNRNWLARTGAQLRPHHVAVEFRHRSWAAPNLSEWMEHIGMDLVSVGVPDVPTLFPRGLRVANRRVYARLHSQSAENWYQDGKLRYAYDYTEEQLREWADGLRRLAETHRADEALIFFNNCVGTQAVSNAERLRAVLQEAAPCVQVVDAPRPPSLFG